MKKDDFYFSYGLGRGPVIFVSALFLLAGCLPAEQLQRAESLPKDEVRFMCDMAGHSNEKVYYIDASTHADTDGKLKIGAGNIWKSASVNGKGESVNELTAGLWLWLGSEDSVLKKTETVRVCQEIEFAGYHVRVVEISESGVSVAVW